MRLRDLYYRTRAIVLVEPKGKKVFLPAIIEDNGFAHDPEKICLDMIKVQS